MTASAPTLSLYDLFQSVIDCSDPVTRANLRFISDSDANCDTLEYAQIWCSLASTLWCAYEAKIDIKLPGKMPSFVIGDDHITDMYWYEVIYRSLRVVANLQQTFKELVLQYQDGLDRRTEWEKLKEDLDGALGVHRIVTYVLGTHMKGYADQDMGYTEKDSSLDVEATRIALTFTCGILHYCQSEYIFAARYFYACEKMASKRKEKSFHKKTIAPLCKTMIYQSMAQHHMSKTKKYTMAVVYLNRAGKDPLPAENLCKTSALPQVHATAEDCQKEMSIELPILFDSLEGKNALDLFPFTLLSSSSTSGNGDQ